MPEKDETYWKVLDAAMGLDIRKGHLRWTISDLARSSGITRSLIYYYFSKEKAEILKAAVDMIGREFLGLEEGLETQWSSGDLAKTVVKRRKQMQLSPHIASFYLSNRAKETEVGQQLFDLEQQFVGKLQKMYPQANEKAVKAFYGLLFGMIFAPVIDEESVVLAVEAAAVLMRNVEN